MKKRRAKAILKSFIREISPARGQTSHRGPKHRRKQLKKVKQRIAPRIFFTVA
jgi:hypothetical protein